MDTEDLFELLLANCFSPVSPGAIDPYSTSPRVRAIYAAVVEAFPDARFTPSWRVVQEGRAAAGGLVSGTHLGDLRGVPPTGRPIEMLAMLMVECTEGEVRDVMVVHDSLAVAEQIGLIPALGPKACQAVD